MNVFVIHDPRRPDSELELCERELQRQDISEYGIWPATIAGYPTVEDCIAESHKSVIRQAIEMGLDEVCVMESDVWFPRKGAWDYFLKNKPSEFDIWLAGIYRADMEALRRYASLRKSFRGPVTAFATNWFAGFHCYIMHSRYFQTFLDSPAGHIDVVQEGRGDFRICYPFAALQRRSTSAIHRQEVDYNADLCKADVFGGYDLA